jgi:hypothetical protein
VANEFKNFITIVVKSVAPLRHAKARCDKRLHDNTYQLDMANEDTYVWQVFGWSRHAPDIELYEMLQKIEGVEYMEASFADEGDQWQIEYRWLGGKNFVPIRVWFPAGGDHFPNVAELLEFDNKLERFQDQKWNLSRVGKGGTGRG